MGNYTSFITLSYSKENSVHCKNRKKYPKNYDLYLYFPMMWPSTRRLSTAMWLNTYNVLTENKNKAKKICTWLLAKTFNWDTSRTRLPKRRRLSSSFFTVAQTLCKVFSVVSVTLLFCSIALRIWYCNIILRNRRLSPDF